MSWSTVLVTIFVGLVEVYFSYQEKTLLRRQREDLNMSFFRNWAVSIGWLIIFPIINGLIFDRLQREWYLWFVGLINGFVFTRIAFELWWRQGNANRGHVLFWEKQRSDHWFKDVTVAGGIRFISMVVQFAIMYVFLFSPMPLLIVWVVGILLAVFIFVINMQAKIVQGSLNRFLLLAEIAFLLCILAFKHF